MSARLSDKTNSWKECIQIIIHVWLFLGVNVFHNPSSFKHYERLHTHSFMCNIESKLFTWMYNNNGNRLDQSEDGVKRFKKEIHASQ